MPGGFVDTQVAVLRGEGRVIDGKTGEVKCTFKLHSEPVPVESAEKFAEKEKPVGRHS